MPSAPAALPPPLFEGDRLDAAEFIRRWEALPDVKFAELINGVVFLGSPTGHDHGTTHHRIHLWIGTYVEDTPGCEAGSDETWVVGPSNVPQPDIYLRIMPEHGGQSAQTPDGKYATGAPELIVEVTGSSRSRDLGVKKDVYRAAGVREYVTVELSARRVTWRQLVRGRYSEIKPDADGLLRSRVFPGLWLDASTIWKGRILDAVRRGIQSPEHAAFVKRLAAARRRK